MLQGKKIVLGITGGIAAYKVLSLIRLLIKAGAEVQPIVTPAGNEFVTSVSLSALTGKPVIKDFFNANTGEWHSHVDLGLWSDLMVIAPATANTLAKMANGIADNMLLTTYLSAKSRVVVVPAMDLDMWHHKATQRNLSQLKEDGVQIIEPGAGELASGLIGKGRMAEPEEIFAHIKNIFELHSRWQGKICLVTAGPTYERIDPVRFIGNFSSGKMGFALAEELAMRGAKVYLITGPSSLEVKNSNITRVNITTACEMLKQSLKVYDQCDYAFFSAAVADYRPENVVEEKIKREGKEIIDIKLVKNPDIAYEFGLKKSKAKHIGFALESNNEENNARLKLKKKNFDWIILNSLKDPDAGFLKDTNKIKIFSKDGQERDLPMKTKRELAKDIINIINNDQNDLM